MKIESPIVKLALYALVIVIVVLGVNVGFVIEHYDVIVRGTLGLTVMYLASQNAFLKKNKDAFDIFLGFPKNIKYIVFLFVYTLVGCWAIIQVFEMVLFLVKLIL